MKVSDYSNSQEISPMEEAKVNPLANSTLPSTSRSKLGLQSYQGEWSYQQAAHLLRRTMFGARKKDIEEVLSLGMKSTIEKLLLDQAAPEPPLNSHYERDADVPIGNTWVKAPYGNTLNGYRKRSLISWSIGLMVNQNISLREKMTLFLHNHFVTQLPDVGDARMAYEYISLIRSYALGNFKRLAGEITINPAMLKYLNGNQNTERSPNENFARELFELFTIGKGPQIGEGNYTNFTEQDVREASRVLTGWYIRNNRNTGGVPEAVFGGNGRHDNGDKVFSEAFDNIVIKDQGEHEYKLLINMIFGKLETARFIIRKLYRWFIYYVIDEETETNIIEPLAQQFFNENFELKGVLQKLFSSQHFYDQLNVGCMIKNPLDFNVGLSRSLEIAQPQELELTYDYWYFIHLEAAKQQMEILNPPNVAGWSAYYQIPQFYEVWINSATLPQRKLYHDRFVFGFRRKGNKYGLDPLKLIASFDNPADPNSLIAQLTDLIFPLGATTTQKDFFKEVLIPGLPDFEWTLEYMDYLNHPEDQNLEKSILTKLNALFSTMLGMAEYHLA